MSLRSYLSRTALVLSLTALVLGCQSQSNPDGKGHASAQTKKVTVDVIGMT